MSRGIKIQKIISETKPRDWQNIPISKIERIVHGMPYAGGLVTSEDKILVSIYLNKSTVHFFKREAGRYHTKYQRFMRAVLDRYAHAHS